MRRVFLIGLATGLTGLWIMELDLKSRLLDILVLLLRADQKTSLPPEPTLFLYLVAIQTVLGLLYTVIAPRLKVSNHFDMVILGISTGILLKWLSILGEKELQTGVALFFLGYPCHILWSHRKGDRFNSIRAGLLVVIVMVIMLLVSSIYDQNNKWTAVYGIAMTLLGTFTEMNMKRPIAATTLQILLTRLLVRLGLLSVKEPRPLVKPYEPPKLTNPTPQPEPAHPLPAEDSTQLTAEQTPPAASPEMTKPAKKKHKRKRGRKKKKSPAP